MTVCAKFLDKHGRPPIGSRVYVKNQHAFGTITSIDGWRDATSMHVEFDGGRIDSRQLHPKDIDIIGPPELLTLDTCPLCEDTIRVKVK